MRARSVLSTLPAAACILAVSIAPAAAVAKVTGQVPGAPGRAAVSPAARIVDDVFNSDSCATLPDNPSIKSSCVAVGFFADGPFVDGLLEFSTNN